MQQTRKSQPDPRPKLPISARLEQIREKRGVSTLKEFREALVKPGGFKVSYSAVRYYHFDRDPPVSYLVRVSEVFGISLNWLATGEGAVTEAEKAALAASPTQDDAFSEGMRRMKEAFPPLVNASPLIQPLVMEVWNSVVVGEMSQRGDLEWPPPPHDIEQAAQKVAEALSAPLRALDLRWELSGQALQHYIIGMCQALLATSIPKTSYPLLSPGAALSRELERESETRRLGGEDVTEEGE